MRKYLQRLGIGIGLATFSVASYATNLLEAYQDALDNDPTFLTAKATYLASKEATPQALAVLLPQLSINYSVNNQGSSVFSEPSGYIINATQTFFSYNQFMALAQASYTVQAGAATFAAAEQDLMQRLSNAYFAVVQAQDILHYTGDQRDATLRQLNALKERYRLGHSTITDVDQSQGAYDTASAQYVAAEIDLYNKVEALSTVTGKHYSKVDTLRDDFPLLRPIPQNAQSWTNHAGHDNLTLRAAQLNVQAALKNISAQKGNYIPNVQGTLNYNSTVDDSQLTGLNKLTYGVGLNYSAFQGGLTMSQVRQAEAQYQSALATRRQAYYQATATAQASYIGVLAGVDQVTSGRRAVKSNYSAFKHTEEGFVAGTQTVLDVLQTQTKLFDAQRAYAADRVKYVLSIVTLENAAGSLSPATMKHLNKWLTPRTDLARPDNTRKQYGNSIQTLKSKYNANTAVPTRAEPTPPDPTVDPAVEGTHKSLPLPMSQKQVIQNLEKKLVVAQEQARADKIRLAQDIALPQPQSSAPIAPKTVVVASPYKANAAFVEQQEQPFAKKLLQATLGQPIKTPVMAAAAPAGKIPVTKSVATAQHEAKPNAASHFFSHLWQKLHHPAAIPAPIPAPVIAHKAPIVKPKIVATESAHVNVQHAAQSIELPQPQAIAPIASEGPSRQSSLHLTHHPVMAKASIPIAHKVAPKVIAKPQPHTSMALQLPQPQLTYAVPHHTTVTHHGKKLPHPQVTAHKTQPKPLHKKTPTHSTTVSQSAIELPQPSASKTALHTTTPAPATLLPPPQ